MRSSTSDVGWRPPSPTVSVVLRQSQSVISRESSLAVLHHHYRQPRQCACGLPHHISQGSAAEHSLSGRGKLSIQSDTSVRSSVWLMLQLMAAAKAYRNALLAMSEATAAFAQAMEACSRYALRATRPCTLSQ